MGWGGWGGENTNYTPRAPSRRYTVAEDDKDYFKACMDDSRPFGHEHVVTCMLLGLKPWERFEER